MVSKIGPSREADAENRFGAQGINFLKRKGEKAEKHQRHQITTLSQQEALDEKSPCPFLSCLSPEMHWHTEEE